MSNSATLLDLISSSQASKEVTANALFDAESPAALYGRRASATANLTWGYYGGYLNVSGVLTAIPNGTKTLTNGATNYVEGDPTTGNVAVNTTGFTTANIPLYAIVTAGNLVTSYLDYRSHHFAYGPIFPTKVVSSGQVLATGGTANDTADGARMTYLTGNGYLSSGPADGVLFGNGNLTANGVPSTIFGGFDTNGNFRPLTAGQTSLGVAAIGFKELFLDYTNTATVGNVTINKSSGRVNVLAGSSNLTVACNLITANSHVMAMASQNDVTGRVTSVVPSAGNFTINCVAPTANMAVDFVLFGAD